MNPSPETIVELLNTLVVPQFEGTDMRFDISFEKHDDTDEIWTFVDVIFDIDKYYQKFGNSDFNLGTFDSAIIRQVKSCLKYFNIHKSVVETYAE